MNRHTEYSLTNRENALFTFLLEAKEPVTSVDVRDALWGKDYQLGSVRASVSNLMIKLRKKLSADFVIVRKPKGAGYVLEAR